MAVCRNTFGQKELIMIDTHTHIYGEEFEEDRTGVVHRALETGVSVLLLPNIAEDSWEPMLQLCNAHPGVCFPMLGLHPTDLPENPQPLLDRMEQALENPEHPYVAIGEVGIDLYWDDTRASEQVVALQRQAEWAIRFNLPLIIHSRAAHRLLVDTLLPFADKLPGGIFHCFGGTAEEAEELLTTFPRFVLGIGGVVTFKKSTLPEVLKTTVPLSHIVLETDAPYLAPTPHRGKRNEPAYLTLVAQKLAEIYDVSTAEVERVTTETALRIFPKLKDATN